MNGLSSHNLLSRNGGAATLATNIASAPLTWFEDPSAGDLHLTAAGTGAVDSGTDLPQGVADGDIDLESRNSLPDAGADEVTPILFSDGFESGDTLDWSLTQQ